MTSDAPSSPSSPSELEEYYEKMFANRYSESDTDFQSEISKPLPPPPCVTNWYTKRRHDYGRQGRSDGRDREGYNQQWGNRAPQRDYHGGRRDYDDRHRSHYGDRDGGRGHYGNRGGGRGHYGGRGGYYGDRDRRQDYNRNQGHYQGNRYGDRSYS